jgi:hypothetical protein
VTVATPATWPFPRPRPLPPMPERAGEWVPMLERIRELRTQVYDAGQRCDYAAAARAAVEMATVARELELVMMELAR